MFTSIFVVPSFVSTLIPFAKFFLPLRTSVIPPANPPDISATPGTSETAIPAIVAITSSSIIILLFSFSMFSLSSINKTSYNFTYYSISIFCFFYNYLY